MLEVRNEIRTSEASFLFDEPGKGLFLETLKLNDSVLTEFDEKLRFAVIDKVMVYTDDDIHFPYSIN